MYWLDHNKKACCLWNVPKHKKWHSFQVPEDAKYEGRDNVKGIQVEEWKYKKKTRHCKLKQTWSFQVDTNRLVNLKTKITVKRHGHHHRVDQLMARVWDRIAGHHAKKMELDQFYNNLNKVEPPDHEFEIPQYCQSESSAICGMDL